MGYKMMTDNQQLLTQVMTGMHTTPFPNITLLSDWGLTHEIAQSLRLLPSSTILSHAKGHQDETTGSTPAFLWMLSLTLMLMLRRGTINACTQHSVPSFPDLHPMTCNSTFLETSFALK
jgi:hypothetical protein